MPFSLIDLLGAGGLPSGLAQADPAAAIQAGAVPPPQGGPVSTDIAVTGKPIPDSQYKDRQGILANLFPGTFRAGSTGGNILGALKDGFLIQSGHNPMYAPKLDQLRQSEALADFNSDPEGSLKRLAQIDPDAAMKGYQQLYANRRADEALDLQRDTAKDAHAVKQRSLDDAVNDRIAAALGMPGLNSDSYAKLLPQLKAIYQRTGAQPYFDLPDTFDQGAIDSIRYGSIKPKDQISLQDQRNYRDAVLSGQLKRAYISQGGANSRAAAGISAGNARAGASLEERKRHNQTMEKLARDRLNKSGGRPGALPKLSDILGN